MKNNSQKDKRKNKNKFSTIIVLALIFISVTFTVKLVEQNRALNQLKNEKASYEKQMSSLNEEIEELKKDYEKKDSMEFVEKIAREKLGMIKSQELIVIDKEDEDKKEETKSNKSKSISKSVKKDNTEKEDN
ncbi:MAG: septum formation initiator family protein [Tissierellia bacterium]|nr:septum formation initiator family protein [Tissierellia bacterium]